MLSMLHILVVIELIVVSCFPIVDGFRLAVGVELSLIRVGRLGPLPEQMNEDEGVAVEVASFLGAFLLSDTGPSHL